ncbi:HNH/endonuclease VII fold putative polymorphic toxin, partial [Prolixibacter bellariivorans]
ETVFDNSPLNRVMEQGAPGQAWQLAGGHTVKAEYLSNAANEVALYRVDPVTDSLATGTPSWYDAGTLYKTVTKDENWTDQGSAALNKLHTTEEFKDILGRVILKRSYALESGSTTQVDELNTYYVYDDFGLLRYVFPPKAFADGNNSINATEMDSLCYTYKYDGRRRMFEKKLPGAEPVYMLYDKRDRLIAIQDGDMRANSEWEFTKYDALNRPVMIGIKTSSKTRADQQAYLDSYNGVYYESRTSTGIGYTLTQSFADRYTAKEKKLLKVIYYDDYDYPGCKAFDGSTNISGYSDASGDSRYFDNVKGQVTGVREKVLDGNELTTDGVWLASTTYYDDRYRVIETLKDLYPQSSGNYEVSSSKYDFVGDVLLSKTVQSFQGNTDSIREAYSYDHAGRMTQIQYALNNNAPVILSSMEYNELGQLKRKTLNGAPGAGAQELKYAYNIRGWLSQINDPSVAPGSNSTEKFNLALYYNTTPSGLTADPQYNGNISAMVWNTPYNDGALSPTGKQGYGFTYDALNRLLTADYGEGSSFATNAGANNVAITGYDRNGNIMGLTRQLKGTGTIDDLSYAYDGNQLRAVNDAGDRHIGYIEGATPHTVEYTYDENGNLTSDSNKGISGIKYNYLNLPRHMYAGTTKIDYLYTFSGTKVCKLNINGDTIAHYYAGNFVYEGSSLKYILHEEGMVTTPSTSPVYLYDLKDHLGNTRLEVNSSGTVTQQTDYYPFGLAFKIAGSSDNKYLYNGKELQDDAIGNGTLGWYDYGARMYEPEIGRWFVVDPKLELSRRWSPYVYGFDNPIRFIDPDGMWGDDYTGYIQNASPSLRNYNPAKAFIKDISADFLNNFSPLGGIDDAIVTYKNPNATTMDKVNATVEAAVGAVIIVGEGKAPVGEKVGKFETKGGALGQLKRDVKIPRSQQPENVAKEPLRSKGKTVLGGDGKPVMTTEYTHTTTDGNKVVIQDHSAGHTIGNVGPHYNVRPESNTRTGKVSGARTHYEWKNK